MIKAKSNRTNSTFKGTKRIHCKLSVFLCPLTQHVHSVTGYTLHVHRFQYWHLAVKGREGGEHYLLIQAIVKLLQSFVFFPKTTIKRFLWLLHDDLTFFSSSSSLAPMQSSRCKFIENVILCLLRFFSFFFESPLRRRFLIASDIYREVYGHVTRTKQQMASMAEMCDGIRHQQKKKTEQQTFTPGH